MTEQRRRALDIIREVTGFRYLMRWLPGDAGLDYDGAINTIEAFRVVAEEQLEFLRAVRPRRTEIIQLVGNPFVFIFHTPEATAKHYGDLLSILEGVEISDGDGIKVIFDRESLETRAHLSGNVSIHMGDAA